MTLSKKALQQELQARHGCHTVILYGSHARGDARASSDFDVLGVRESGAALRDARLWRGAYLDAFIYPEAMLDPVNESLLGMRDGVVLCQKADFGTRFLSRLNDLFLAGPRRLPPDEIQALKVWAHKTLARIREGDTEANFRRAWLLNQLLQDYFPIRGQWYLGPKMGLRWLRENDPSFFAAYDAALKPHASMTALEKLVCLYAGEEQSGD
jgi:predicted nucleotidyltransferase